MALANLPASDQGTPPLGEPEGAYSNYYPFGIPQPNRNFDSQEYRYGFQGQEKDSEIKGEGLSVNYKYRMHDPRVDRFFAVDPLATKFPWNSTYAFAENRLIDGLELEGREWDKSTDDQGNMVISVNTNFSIDNETLDLTDKQISDYQKAINIQLNNTLKSSSGGTISGVVTFNGGDGKGRLVPNLDLYGRKHTGDPNAPFIAGINTFGNNASVNLYNKDGSLKTPKDAAKDAVHELLQEHPFERTQGSDTKLIHDGGNSYLTTSETDPDIFFNIMNYSLINIDGQNLGIIWSPKEMTLLTNDQIKLMVNEIGLQKQGFGAIPHYDREKMSQDEFLKLYRDFYQNYWDNPPGVEVEKKQQK